ncbi:MAG TPA: L-threonine 3-dehydrogenase [Clostridiaceae bacterium]|nr:L-threonine 3-dehydrogenase [Clostridiaceae bacterium]
MKVLMKAVKKLNKGKGVEITTAAIPEPGPGEVLIRVKVAGICGTDLHIFKWDEWSQKRIKPPVIIGHEFVGEIVQVGFGVNHLRAGQRVSAEGHITCGRCKYCRNGQGHICQDVKLIGVDINGCFAEYICIPAVNVWPVHDDIPDKYAAIFDPLGNAMHAVMVEPVSMKNVLIIGAGSIGLFAIPIAKANGAGKIIVIDPNPMKRDIALKVGADLALDPEDSDLKDKVISVTGKNGPDRLLEMSGSSSALCVGLDLLGNGGSVSLLGIPPNNISINLAEKVIFKGITLHGITGRRMYETWYQCESFLLNHGNLIDPIITHCIDIEDIENGFRWMEANEAVKVLLKII